MTLAVFSEPTYFDEPAAARVDDFFSRYLVHIEGEWAGKPFRPEQWQRRDVLRPIFGTKYGHNHDVTDISDASGLMPRSIRQGHPACAQPSCRYGLRVIRTAYIEVPKKNGKSTTTAGIGLYMLTADKEPGSQVYIAANSAKQARLIFHICSEMILRNPELREKCEVLTSVSRILYRDTGSFLQVLSGNPREAQGINASCVIFDEFHTQKTRELYDALRYSTRARRQPLFVMITTAGYDQESICYEEHARALRLINGEEQDPTYLPVIYAAEAKDDPFSEATWRKANPGWEALGRTFQAAIRADAEEAKRNPSKLNSFLRYTLDLWTSQEEAWMDVQNVWDASAGLVVPEKLKGRYCYAAIDGAFTTDLCSLALVFPPADGDPEDSGDYEVLPYFWMPQGAVEKLRSTPYRASYERWAQEGFVRITPGEVLDLAVVKKKLHELRNIYDIRHLYYDPRGLIQFAVEVNQEAGDDFCVSLNQGYALSAAMKEVMRLVVGRRLVHGGHPVLRHHVGNVVMGEGPNGEIRVVRKASRFKVDGAVALVMAVFGALQNREQQSVVVARGGFLYV